ncbi:MAG TPA: sigma-70 family RNA polymerase sigma factor [Armatimonadota bacterium]|jgi:RNA polymerase sigma-70 factor (ECF subfamily)
MKTGLRSDSETDLLVAQARVGEAFAFERLVEKYHGRVYNYITRMVHDSTDAQDVAQETFVRAYQGLPRFRGASSFQTWLYRIASNLAIDAARGRSRRALLTVSMDDPIEQDDNELERDLPDEGENNPPEALEREELRSQVWEALGELSLKLRPVIVLSDLEGLSYQEIAQVLGCPVGTVKSRLFNARSQMRDKLNARLHSDWGSSGWVETPPAGVAIVDTGDD